MIACPRCGHPNADDARYCSNCALPLGAATSAAEARKTVTVLFMDAVGSTGLGESADPETMRRVMTRYFEEIRATVERHGGTVEKYIGDAVMAVFGVPVVHEDDALRAVRAAAEIRARLAEVEVELRQSRGLAIRWRTGINTGEVVAGDSGAGQHFVTGDAVNVAARLEQAAAPGEIMLGAETRRLLRDQVTIEAIPAVSAKGKTASLEAFRLVAVGPPASGRARHLEAPMVGRERPRRLLEDAFDQARTERVCHLFTVLGAAGVGKSRLVREFLQEVGSNALALRGRCLSYGEGITYWPIAEVIREAAGLTEDDTDEDVGVKLGRLVSGERDRAKAVSRLGELVGRFTGAASREETFWAVRIMVESLARERPLILVLDDVHWAEPTLLDLIENLAEWTTDAPVLLICISRQELLEARPSWGGGKSYATTITLEPLNQQQSRQLVLGLLGQVELEASIERRIAGASEGNPLFVEELIGMLIDSGRLVERDGAWSVAGKLDQIEVPPTIHALLSARLDSLPSTERVVIERAAIEGQVFHRGAVVELAPDAIRDTVPLQLRALARKELIRSERSDAAGDEAFRFRHLLIRDAAYSALPKETRAELHARFAGWLSRTAADHLSEYQEILGYHYEQAAGYRAELGLADAETSRLRSSAVEHLAAAAERAVERSDIAAARKLLESATRLAPADDAGSRRLRVQLADALAKTGEIKAAEDVLKAVIESAEQAGDTLGKAYAELGRIGVTGSLGTVPISSIIEESRRLLELFRRHGDTRGTSTAAYELARHEFFAGHAHAAQQILMGAVDPNQPGSTAAQLAGWLPAALVWGPMPTSEAEPIVRDLLDSAANRSVEAMAEACLGMLRAFVGEFDEARVRIDRAITIRRELGMIVHAYAHQGNFQSLVEILAGDYAEAEHMLLASFKGLTGVGEYGFGATVAGHIAGLYVVLGRYGEAEEFAQRALAMSPVDDIDAQARGLSAKARVLAARGQLAQALEHMGHAQAIVESTDYLDLRGQTYTHLGEIRLLSGEVNGARGALTQALAEFESKGITVEAWRTRRRLAEIA